MQTIKVRLESPVSNSFRCSLAAQSLDIDVKKKSVHELSVTVNIDNEFNVGLIVGASGSGKTTLAKQIFGQDIFEKISLDQSLPIIEQLPKNLTYDECATILSGIGLTSVPCWIRPVNTLSNGQKARAEAALAMQQDNAVIDEWTSVVDRTVAKSMSHCVQKFARSNKKKIILLSCHYDVIEWLDPDWVIDCNKQKFIDRRLLPAKERTRKEQLQFHIRAIDRSSWKYFSKYHYLSEKVPGGKTEFFGLFHNQEQVGFLCFANYVPKLKSHKTFIMHSNRLVIHPDYCGLGLGIKFVNEYSKLMKTKGYIVRAKFSSIPMYRSRIRDSRWKCIEISRNLAPINVGSSIGRSANLKSFRKNVKTFTFEFIG